MLSTKRSRISTPYFVCQVSDEKWRISREPGACLEDVEDIDAINLLEIEEGEKSLFLKGGNVHRGSFFFVVNDDLCFPKGAKIGAQQIHVLEV